LEAQLLGWSRGDDLCFDLLRRVTGVDMTPAFCESAVALDAAFGMADRVMIHNGSALDLPLPDAAFFIFVASVVE